MFEAHFEIMGSVLIDRMMKSDEENEECCAAMLQSLFQDVAALQGSLGKIKRALPPQ
jgi:hypothetical protein